MRSVSYVIPYFINNLELFYNYVLSADLTVTDFDTELNVYLKKCTPYLKGVLYKEPNFNRLLFKNGNLCAVFTSPKKYKGIIHSIAKVGFKSVNIKTLCRVIDMQQKILTARESSQDLFFVVKSAFNNAEKFPSIKTITHRRFCKNDNEYLI